MRSLSRGLILPVLAVLLSSCGLKNSPDLTQGTGAGLPTNAEAATTRYPYGFSGRVVSSTTGDILENFSVTLASSPTGLATVLNSLGNRNGIFHISRPEGASVESVPVLISSEGHEPLLQWLGVAADCEDCSGSLPETLVLSPDTSPQSGSVQAFFPQVIQYEMNKAGTAAIFQQLVADGTLDTSIQAKLKGATNGTELTDILIQFNDDTAATSPEELIADLLGTANPYKLQGISSGLSGLASSLIPLIAKSSPELSAALLAAQLVLPYLSPVIEDALESRNGPLAQMLKTLLTDSNAQFNLTRLIESIQSGNKSQGIQFAMATFLPMLGGLIGKKENPKPFESFLSKMLMDPKLYSLIGALTNKNLSKDDKVTSLVLYLQPLLNGLLSPKSPQLAAMLNQLLSEGGLAAIKSLKEDKPLQEKFAILLPYLQPLIQGLNSKDESALVQYLKPALSSGDPASSLLKLIPLSGELNSENLANYGALNPGLGTLLKGTLSQKQLFAAQLMQGVINKNYKTLKVARDLQGAPAIVVQGSARDIFSVAQLPNVRKVVALP